MCRIHVTSAQSGVVDLTGANLTPPTWAARPAPMRRETMGFSRVPLAK